MKETKSLRPDDMILLLPMAGGELLELNFNIEEAEQILAPDLVVEKLTEHCIPVATSNDYNLLILDL